MDKEVNTSLSTLTHKEYLDFLKGIRSKIRETLRSSLSSNKNFIHIEKNKPKAENFTEGLYKESLIINNKNNVNSLLIIVQSNEGMDT